MGRIPAGHGRFLAVNEGVVETAGNRVSVLTERAVAADKIDQAKVEEARQPAEADLKMKISSEEIASVNTSIARSLAQRQVT